MSYYKSPSHNVCGCHNPIKPLRPHHDTHRPKHKEEKKTCGCFCERFIGETPVEFQSLVINGRAFRVNSDDPVHPDFPVVATITLTNINKKTCCATVRVTYVPEAEKSPQTYRDIACHQLGPYIE
ncbi:hypothetical protein [Alkalihalobacterium alkalinitrilicum]|uniref:hypothetical protein n=1 Tax=Alkalihalobacterium alkalinitrilicum TaxID=427920 RepID=UPI000994EAFD|nr:hypothetical protein [Alkalihalobacterium alkalinitrilicum]